MTRTLRGIRTFLSRFARLALVATVLTWTTAWAEVPIPSFELERLQLNPGAGASLLLGTGEILPAGSLRLSLVSHFEKNPFLLYRNGTRSEAVVGQRATVHLMAAYAPTKWLQLDAQLPIVVFQGGDAQGSTSPDRAGLSTPTLSARIGLLAQRDAAPVDLALQLDTGLPLGAGAAFTRDPGFRLMPRVMVGRTLDWLRVGLNAALLARPFVRLGNGENITGSIGSELALGAVLATTGEGLRGELNLLGSVPLTGGSRTLEVLAGARMPLSASLEAFALGGVGLGTVPGTPTWRMLAGIAFKLPEPFARRSEPAPREHSKDESAGTPKGMMDTDGDGVRNDADKCPNEYGPVELGGCPLKDADNDGVIDAKDACPALAGLVELRGCPAKDTDGDTVADHLDNCPNAWGPVANQGCPANRKQWVIIRKEKLELKQKVFFATNQAKIQRKSFELLNQVASVLLEHPEIGKVAIEGHTDNVGTAARNRQLSLARANAVLTYLIDQGVSPSRLDAQGYGPDRPIESNATAQGREVNRRVEFFTQYAQ